MRILHVLHQGLPRWVGGTELYVHQLATALQAMGHAAELFVREAGDPSLGLRTEPHEGVTVHRFYTPPPSEAGRLLATFYHPGLTAGFAEVLGRFRPAVVHFHHLLGLPVELFWRALRAGLPTVLTLHDYWFVCANTKLLTNYDHTLCQGPRAWLNCARCGLARLNSPWAWPLTPAAAPVFMARDVVLRRVLRRADRLVAPSRFLRETYVRLGAPADRTVVAPTGIAPPPLAAPPARPPGGLRALYVGALLPLKGVHVLVEAFEALPPEATLWVAGDPNRDPAYAARLRALARHPGVVFLGPLDRAGVWRALDEADVVVVPSLWYENSPLVVQEARARGRPVVASRLGALAELVRDGVDGALTPPGDPAALGRLLAGLTPETLARWAANRPPVRTSAALAEDMARLYDQLVGRA